MRNVRFYICGLVMNKFFMVVIFFWGLIGSANAFTPSSEQLKIFEQLSDEEKRALYSKYMDGAGAAHEAIELPKQQIETVKPIRPPLAGQTDGNYERRKHLKYEVEGNDIVEETSQAEKPFGYYLFAGQPTTFAPVNSIPVPTDYILGPGDQIKISLYGTKNESFKRLIDRNGNLNTPYIGPVSLAGMTFSEARIFLSEKLSSLGVGVNASVGMGELRSFRVFVLGESRVPGSYLVSGMATMTHALYVSGGLTDIASYRNVQLKRQGRLVKTLDLYDLLLKGDTSNDMRLQPGDTVFIPKVKRQITVKGQVLNPALYELKYKGYLKDVLELAGGLAANAYSKSIQVSRITSPEVRQNFSLDLADKSAQMFEIKNGDQITVPEVVAEASDLVKVSGAVSLEGEFGISENDRLLDLLPTRKHFLNDADLKAVFIKRQKALAEDYELLSVSWLSAMVEPDSKDNLKLHPRDEIIVLSQNDVEKRKEVVKNLLEIMAEQEKHFQPNRKVSISGSVKYEGDYPLVRDMRVADLLSLSGGLMSSAVLGQAELTRYKVIDGSKREAETITLSLAKALNGDEADNIILQPHDSLTVKRVTDWQDASSRVVVSGEVAYPGTYYVKPGETLENLLIRAGGFTQWAAPQNVVFTRENLKLKERQEMDAMADELEKNLLFSLKENTSAESGSESNANAMIALGKTLVDKIKSTPAIGRLVIGLNPVNINRYQASLQLELRDGDELFIPKRSNEIVVMGEVSRPASLLFQKGLTLENYLDNSGGLTKRADKDSIYIVRGDGSILPYESSLFSFSDNSVLIQPGDTIVVPMDVERVSPIFTWTAVTKILSNLAVTAATLQTLGVIK
jgi:protein involved in polysaccharide export with SLBB domain